jgi:hypothetical protein
MANNVIHVEVVGKDGPALQKFYGDIFVRDSELFELLDVARRIFNANLTDTIDMLRLVDTEPAATGGR